MQIASIAQPPFRAPAHPRLLVVKASTIWLWPGVALTEQYGSTIRAIEPDALRFWLGMLLGPEIIGMPVPNAIARAAEYLTAGDTESAQHCLDRATTRTLSPEGAMLAAAVAARIGLIVPEMAVNPRMPLWDRDFVAHLAPLYDRFAEVAEWLDKASGWDPNLHPRWPKGSTDGGPGQFKPIGKPTVPSGPSFRPDPNRRGIGHNGGPPLFDDVPPVPPEDPGPSYRWPIIKAVAKWAAQRAAILAGEDAVGGPIGPLLNAAQVAIWIYEYYPYIRAYSDPPRSLDELEEAAQGPARKGYEVHHIVWQESGSLNDVSREKIDAPENLVSIPTLRHWELSSWYQTPNENFLDADGSPMTPRKYLAGKGYAERRRVGLIGLQALGILE